ncbi:MAG: biotin/lipoyl-containing protein [Armatimonadia bacterium]
MTIDRERVLELLEVLKGSSAGEISVKEGDTTIRLMRMVTPVVAEAPEAPVAAPTAATGKAAGGPEMSPEGRVTVKARVVGLFYRGKLPGGEPLVQVGDQVKEGQALGSVEVLRKPTEVVSPVSGTVVEVLAEDGHGVQYGDTLFVIEVG